MNVEEDFRRVPIEDLEKVQKQYSKYKMDELDFTERPVRDIIMVENNKNIGNNMIFTR